MPKPHSRIRSAAIDERAHNPFYRKTQLKQLHEKLVQNAAAIQKAIAADTGHTTAEVKVEFYLGLQCVKDSYASIDPKASIEAEYSIANGKNAEHNVDPVGVVVIQPTEHTLFYSIMSALAPAIAAGNCVILQVRAKVILSLLE
jgi:acyl-CoA reductase-like NAD-dependent aldehyde dehydrogenase